MMNQIKKWLKSEVLNKYDDSNKEIDEMFKELTKSNKESKKE